ncbi:hypothetical protein ACF058_06410 [Streptomyces sp. NPDC015501]|uniref:hypothetical protein n=1 Tax=unclassified Streptomyces TaxID=2593676 RepID=UPI0036FE3936
MSGPEQRRGQGSEGSGGSEGSERRHENDPTGNGIVNHGPEKTPHTDPDHPHEGSVSPEPGGTPEPPARGAGDAGEGPEGPGPEEEAPEEPGEPAAAEHADGPEAGEYADGPEAGEASEGRTRPEDARERSAREDAAERNGGTAPVADTGPSAAETPVTDSGKDADSVEGGATVGGGGAGPVAATGPSAAETPGAEDRAAPGDDGDGGGDGDDIFGTLTSLFAADRTTGRTGDPRSTASEELDEVALRRMLHGAVRDLAPSDGTLDHLHRAVPARRARRRQAVVGAAAAVLLIGTAVPAFVHVATSDGASTARPAIAGHGEQAQGGNGGESGPEEPGRRTVEPTDGRSEGGADEADPDPSPTRGEGRDPDATATGQKPAPVPGDIAALPVCEPGQLGVASAGTDAPAADGTVYGRFKIANVSGKDCTVSGNGTVGFTTLGAADPLKIGVVQHAAGDAAPGLPDPSQEPGTVLLKPAMAYEVRFAWVPTDTCPTTVPTPSPTPSTDGTGGSAGEGTDQSGDTAQSLTEDGGTAEGSIAVTHTPEAGAPTAETTIPNACSGTIYRTGVLATS